MITTWHLVGQLIYYCFWEIPFLLFGSWPLSYQVVIVKVFCYCEHYINDTSESFSFLRPRICHSTCKRHASSSKSNHYDVLGVKDTASAKEIKSKFYELSKKHHPDRNPDKSHDKFQDIVNAYEVLSSKSKRAIYDSTLKPATRATTSPYSRNPRQKQKDYEDLDINYEDFQEFQRQTRERQRVRHEDIPEQFFNQYGGKKFKQRTSKDAQFAFATYKDSLAYQREERERRLHEEMEKERKARTQHVPHFEQELRKKRERSFTGPVFAASSLLVLFLAVIAYLFRA